MGTKPVSLIIPALLLSYKILHYQKRVHLAHRAVRLVQKTRRTFIIQFPVHSRHTCLQASQAREGSVSNRGIERRGISTWSVGKAAEVMSSYH